MNIDEILKNASPRPWKLVRTLGTKMTVVIIDSEGRNIDYMVDSYDAELIFLAVNNFDRMREALKIIISRAGLPDAKEACRLIIQDAKEALREIEK